MSIQHLSFLFVIAIAILPLLSPGLQQGSFAVEPETYKTAIAVGGSGVFLLMWLLSQPLNSAIRIVKTSFYLPILAFLIWNIVSFYWLVDVEAGLLATTQYISMSIGFFLALDICYKDESNVKKILKFLVVSGLLVAVLGLLQYYFKDSASIQNFSRQAVNPGSSFGNKNMSSQFLVLVLPISIILLWRAHYLKNVIFFTITSVVMLWFLTHTHTRGGWVAATLQIIFLLSFIVLDYRKNKSTNKPQIQTVSGPKVASVRNKRIIIAIGALVYFLGANYTDRGFSSDDRFANKVSSIVSGDDNGRLPAWTNTLNLIKDNLLFGVGSGNWEASYPLYYDSSVDDVIYNERVRLRRLHNSYLEMASNVGLVGFGFLLWLVFLTVRAVSRILLNPESPHRYMVLGMALGLIGFTISAMVSFPLRVYLPGLIVLLYIGIIAAIYAKTTKTQVSKKYTKDINFLHSSDGLPKLLLLPVVIFAFLSVFISYNWLWAGHYHQKSIEYLHAGHNKRAMDLSVSSVQHSPYRAKALGLLGNNLKNTNIKLAISYLEKSVKYNPNNSLTVLALADSYYQLATQYIKKGNTDLAQYNYNKHFDILKHLTTFDPRNVRGHALLVRYYLQIKQIDKAKASYQQALKWQKYFIGRQYFGPYNGLMNAVETIIRPHLDKAKTTK